MESNVFISNFSIKPRGYNLNEKFNVEINIFDKRNEEEIFSSSLMTEDEAKKYEKNILKILNSDSLFHVKYNPRINTLKTILDYDNSKTIIGLESKKGIIFKNEIKFY